MSNSLKFFNQALDAVHDRFSIDPIIILCSIESYDELYTTYAHNYQTITIGRQKTYYYRLHNLSNRMLSLTCEMQRLLSRYFALKLINVFDIEKYGSTQNKIKYLINLSKLLLNDSDNTIENISQLELFNEYQFFNGNIEKNNELHQEKKLMFNPANVFNMEYENWKPLNEGVNLNGRVYNKIEDAKLNLADILRNENIEPMLRIIIKHWIVHLIRSNIEQLNLTQDEFFKCDNLEQILENYEKSLASQLINLLNLSIEARKEFAKAENSANKYSLKPKWFNLAQRIPFIKLFVGHARFDIHWHNNSFLKQVFAFIASHFNFGLIEAWLAEIKKCYTKSFTFMKPGTLGSIAASIGLLLIANLMAMIGVAILPFFVLMGITSIPFSMLKKALNFTPNSYADIAIVIIEAIKDTLLFGYFAKFLTSLNYFQYSKNIFEKLFLKLVIFSRINGINLDSLVIWLFIPFGFLPYLIPTYFDEFVKSKRYPVHLSILLLSGAMWLGLVLSVDPGSFIMFAICFGAANLAFAGICNLAVYYGLIGKTNNDELFNQQLQHQNQNLNHSQGLRNLLAKSVNTDVQNITEQDKYLLNKVKDLILDSTSKAKLKELLEDLVDDPDQESKQSLHIALMNIDKNGYFPSFKLVEKLRAQDIQDQALQAILDKSSNIYSSLPAELR